MQAITHYRWVTGTFCKCLIPKYLFFYGYNHLELARYTLPAAQELLQVGYTSFLVHRDPIERFVSGYIDKCIKWVNYFHLIIFSAVQKLAMTVMRT